MDFREIFQKFYEQRETLKVVFVGTSDENGRPNCSPKLVIDIAKSGKVYYIDFKTSQSYENVLQNWQSSVAFMNDRSFEGFRLSGFSQILEGGRDFEIVRERWAAKAVAYQAERMIERIKGIFSSRPAEIDMPEDFVIVKFTAEEASIVKPDRVFTAMRKQRSPVSAGPFSKPIGRIIALQTRIGELERVGQRHEKAERELGSSRDLLKRALDGVPDQVMVIDRHYNVIVANEAVRQAVGAACLAETPTLCYKLSHQLDFPCHAKGFECPLQKAIESRAPVTMTHTHADAGGHPKIVEISAVPIFDEKGEVDRIVETCRDVTDQVERQQQIEARQKALQEAALEDELTGLYNRRGFKMLVEHQLKLARRSGKECFVLFSDIDRLKPINDTFGHPMGDRALVDAAGLLRKTFRDSDVVARIGGDEFAVAVIDCDKRDINIVTERLKSNLKEFNTKRAAPYPLGLSLGVASCKPGESTTLDELLQQADKSMYEDKTKKRSAGA